MKLRYNIAAHLLFIPTAIIMTIVVNVGYIGFLEASGQPWSDVTLAFTYMLLLFPLWTVSSLLVLFPIVFLTYRKQRLTWKLRILAVNGFFILLPFFATYGPFIKGTIKARRESSYRRKQVKLEDFQTRAIDTNNNDKPDTIQLTLSVVSLARTSIPASVQAYTPCTEISFSNGIYTYAVAGTELTKQITITPGSNSIVLDLPFVPALYGKKLDSSNETNLPIYVEFFEARQTSMGSHRVETSFSAQDFEIPEKMNPLQSFYCNQDLM